MGGGACWRRRNGATSRSEPSTRAAVKARARLGKPSRRKRTREADRYLRRCLGLLAELSQMPVETTADKLTRRQAATARHRARHQDGGKPGRQAAPGLGVAVRRRAGAITSAHARPIFAALTHPPTSKLLLTKLSKGFDPGSVKNAKIWAV